jgi:hypothetical protein
MKCKLTEYVKAEFYQTSQMYWTDEDINKFMDKAAEYDHECVGYIKEVNTNDLMELIYQGEFDLAKDEIVSIRRTMIFKAKREISVICDNIEDETINSEFDDHGMSNNDFLMECDR